MVGVDSTSPDVTEELPFVEPSPHPGDLTQRTNHAAARAPLLADLRTPGPWPTPAGPARRAHPGEMPRAALTVRDAAVTPWATSCWYAPAGSVPYTFERRQAGHLLTPLAYVRFWHPDGRYAVGIWILDVHTGAHPKRWRDDSKECKARPTKGHDTKECEACLAKALAAKACKTCPAKGPNPVKLAWSYDEGWRWRGGPNGTFPRPIDATTLKAAVKDPTWRTDPYLIEKEAA